MKPQPKFYSRINLTARLWSLVGAALFLVPLAAQAAGPDLSVTKTCAVNGPQSVLCTVTIKNIGNIASVAPLTLADTPTAPPGSTYTGAGSNLGLLIGCSLGAGPVLPIPCNANKSLAPNETTDAIFSFKVPGGNFTNCVSVTQGQNAATLPDPNPGNNTNICTTINTGTAPPTPPIKVDTPPPTGACANQVVVSGIHYPNQSCAQTTPGFLAGYMSMFHFKSKCTPPNTLLGVTNVTCQNAPIPGFPNGSVYQGTACCGSVAPPDGKLTIVKRIINNNPGIATPGPYLVDVNCGANVPGQTVSLTASNPQQTVNIPSGSACTITEQPPKAPDGCTWVTTYPNGQSGKPGDNLVVKNELICKGACKPGLTESVPGYCCDGKPGSAGGPGSDKFCCWKK